MIRLAIPLVTCICSQVNAAEYWDLEIPVMEGASAIERAKDPATASHSLAFEVALDQHREPVAFYNSYFETLGWSHHMREVYTQFQHQFDNPPMQEWSSTSAAVVDGRFTMQFGALWQNDDIGSDATVTMTVSELNNDDLLLAHVEVSVYPRLDPSVFMEVAQDLQASPKSMLKLADLVGGDPFDIESLDITHIKGEARRDPMVQRYLAAVGAALEQIDEFADEHVGESQPDQGSQASRADDEN